MATFHRMTDQAGREVVRAFVKGAPDVLIERSSTYWSPDDEVHDIARRPAGRRAGRERAHGRVRASG